MTTYSRLKAKAAKLIGSNLDNSMDVFNQIRTAEYTPIIEIKPLPNVSPLRNISDPSLDTASISVVNGEIEIDGTVQKHSLYTRDRGRYLPGLVGMAGLGVRIPDASVGHYEFGYGDSEGNRFGIEIDQGIVYTFIESAGNRYYRKPSSQWADPLNGKGPSGQLLDFSNGCILRLPFGWYGYLSIKFNIGISGLSDDHVIEVDHAQHTNPGVSIVQPDLPIFAEADGGVMYVGGRQFGVFGRYKPSFRVTSPDVVTKSGIGTSYEPIVSFKFKNSQEIQWRAVPAYLDSVSIGTDSKIEYAVFVDTTLTGEVFGDITSVDPDETALQIDSSATSFTGGYKAYSDILISGQGSSQNSEDAPLSSVRIPSGSVVTLAAKSLTTTADVDGILRIREEW